MKFISKNWPISKKQFIHFQCSIILMNLFRELFPKNITLFFPKCKDYTIQLFVITFEESIHWQIILLALSRSYLEKPDICLEWWIMGAKSAVEQVRWKCNEILERNPIKFAGRRGFVNQVSRTRADREDKLKRKTRVSLLVSMRRRRGGEKRR